MAVAVRVRSGVPLVNNFIKENLMYHIMYIPKVEDEVSVAKFETEADAIKFMTRIKIEKPKVYPHHYIKKER